MLEKKIPTEIFPLITYRKKGKEAPGKKQKENSRGGGGGGGTGEGVKDEKEIYKRRGSREGKNIQTNSLEREIRRAVPTRAKNFLLNTRDHFAL